MSKKNYRYYDVVLRDDNGIYFLNNRVGTWVSIGDKKISWIYRPSPKTVKNGIIDESEIRKAKEALRKTIFGFIRETL